MPKQKSTPKHASPKAKPKAKSAALREKELKRKKLLLLAAKAKAEHAPGAKGKGRLPEDVDPEEQADELAAAVEVDPDAAADEVEEEPIADRKEVKDLIEAGPREGLPHLRRGERRAARGHRLLRPDRRRDVACSARTTSRSSTTPARSSSRARSPSPTGLRRGAEAAGRGRGEGRGLRRRLRQVQRPGAHVPAQDGLGLAAHPRGRGGDRQAHRGGREGGAARGALLADRHHGDSRRSARGCASGKMRVREVVKDAPDESRRRAASRAEADAGEADGGAAQLQRERAQPHRADLQAHRQDPQARPRRSSALEDDARTRRSSPRSKRRRCKQEIQRHRDQMMEVPRGDAAQQEADRPHRREPQARSSSGWRRPRMSCGRWSAPTAWPCASCAPLLQGVAGQPARRRRSWPRRLNVSHDQLEAWTATSGRRCAKSSGSRRRPTLPVDELRRNLRGHPRRRAQGRAGQGRAGRGQPAPGGLHRQEVHQPRPAVPRPHPGGQHRPDEGGGQVRVQARLQVLAPTPPGGSARPSPAPSPTRRAPSASRCT